MTLRSPCFFSPPLGVVRHCDDEWCRLPASVVEFFFFCWVDVALLDFCCWILTGSLSLLRFVDVDPVKIFLGFCISNVNLCMH